MIQIAPFLAAAALFTSLNACASPVRVSDRAPQSAFTQVSTWLETTLARCPDRIWPGRDWARLNVLMLEKGQPSQVWRWRTGKTEGLAESDVPAGARQGVFSLMKWQGEDAVSIYSDGTSNPFLQLPMTVFQLIVHEGFHLTGQRGWTRTSGPRGTVYPVDEAPRLYRRMMYERLREHYDSDGANTTALGQAAHWFQQWKSRYPEDVLSATDGIEGTARFVEYVGAALAERSCTANEAQIKAGLKDRIASDKTLISDGSLEADREGYAIGGLAAFTLRFVRRDLGWFERMKRGETPLTVLLKDVSPIVDHAPAELEQQYRAAGRRIHQELSTWLDDEIQRWKDPSSVRIVIPSSMAQASYQPDGFYLPKALPGVSLFPLRQASTFTSPRGSMTAQAKRILALVATPCEQGSVSAVIPRKDYRVLDGEISVSRADLHGKMQGSEVRDAQGLTWFCGKADVAPRAGSQRAYQEYGPEGRGRPE